MCDIDFHHRLDIIKRQFLCTFPVRFITWQDDFNSWQSQEDLINNTIYNVKNIDYPVKLTYQISFLKFVIKNIERNGELVHDIVYNSLGNIIGQLDEDTKATYKHYCTLNNDISLCENVQIISDGTTGLTTWPAALVLAEWCLSNKEQLESKIVLELGAGLGLVGLTTLFNCRPSHIVLTDCHQKVLSKLCDNVRLNLHLFNKKKQYEQCTNINVDEEEKDLRRHNYLLQERVNSRTNVQESSKISVLKHCWGEEDQQLAQDIQPDILLAADVVYDSSLFPLLVACIKALLKQENTDRKKKQLVLVCTERNANTLDEFLELLSEECIVLEDNVPEPKHFFWSTETPIRLFIAVAK